MHSRDLTCIYRHQIWTVGGNILLLRDMLLWHFSRGRYIEHTKKLLRVIFVRNDKSNFSRYSMRTSRVHDNLGFKMPMVRLMKYIDSFTYNFVDPRTKEFQYSIGCVENYSDGHFLQWACKMYDLHTLRYILSSNEKHILYETDRVMSAVCNFGCVRILRYLHKEQRLQMRLIYLSYNFRSRRIVKYLLDCGFPQQKLIDRYLGNANVRIGIIKTIMDYPTPNPFTEVKRKIEFCETIRMACKNRHVHVAKFMTGRMNTIFLGDLCIRSTHRERSEKEDIECLEYIKSLVAGGARVTRRFIGDTHEAGNQEWGEYLTELTGKNPI